MFSLAHLSDPHLGPLPDPTTLELASKRVLGYLNWRVNRSGGMGSRVLDQLVGDLKAQDADHVAVTGTRHCEDVAFRWIHLATTVGTPFVDGARAMLDETLTPERFLLAESLERTVGTWEFRQWRPSAAGFRSAAHHLPYRTQLQAS